MAHIIDTLAAYFPHILGVVVFALIVTFIVGKNTGKLIGHLVKHLLIGVVVFALLHYALNLSWEAAGSFGLISFAFFAIFGKLFTRK